MQNPSRFPLTKRLLFPYNGGDPLTPGQGLRIVLAWTLLFSLPVSLLVLVLASLEGYGTQRTITSVVFAFFSGAFIFGMLSVLIVVMSNRAAHIRQAWKAQNGRS